LSRESDVLLQQEATRSDGAVLVSFWRVPGMPPDSGTATDWLDAPSLHVVHVRCICELHLAATRFLQRQRHPGHLDGESSPDDIVARLRTLIQLPALDVGQRIDVDTSQEFNFQDLVRSIRSAFELTS
jgi:hypothetical protein